MRQPLNVLPWARVRRALLTAGTGALLSPVTLHAELAAQSLACNGIDSVTAVRLAEVKWLVASGDREAVAFRTSLGITGVDSSTVVAATDSTVCTSVTNAVHQAFGLTDPPSESLFVVIVGNKYVATYPREAEVVSMYFLDANYVVLGATA